MTGRLESLLWFVGKKVEKDFRFLLRDISRQCPYSFLAPGSRLKFYRHFASANIATDIDYSLAIAPVDNSYLPNTIDEHQELILLDASCNGTAKLLNNSWHELNDFMWILFKGKNLQPIEEQILSNFANVPILTKSEIFFCYKDVEGDGIHIKQIYKTDPHSPLILEWMGKTSNNKEFTDLRPSKITSRRRQNLRKIGLTAAMVVTSNDTLNHLDDYQFVFDFTCIALSYLLSIFQ